MWATALAGFLLFSARRTGAQNIDANGCMRLLGSIACPGFQYAYLSPGNLSNAFPFFAGVTDVGTFDSGALGYFANPAQFQTTKFTEELGCTNASGAVIQYERTVLCSMWVNEQWSKDCLANYNGSSAATSEKMVCQNTCLDYSASETALTTNADYCPGADLTNGKRGTQITKDFVDCTNWTTLATNDSSTCVSGDENESNCGFGSSTTQLCGFCNTATPGSCCYSSTTNVSAVCGYVLAAASSSSNSSSSPAATAGAEQANKSGGLHGGKLAGAIVGGILGGLLLLGLAALIFICCARRRRRNNRDSGSSFAAGPSTGAGGGGVFGGMFGNRSSHPPNNSSEKGLLGSSGNASSPTMSGNDSSGSSGGRGNSIGSGAAFAAAGLGATGAGAYAAQHMAGTGGFAPSAGPGERTSGVVLPRVRDENQSQERWIETGAEVSVLWPYQASLPDELDLRPGMKIRVLRLYDDAWGTAQVISGGEPGEAGRQGAFPIVCVSEGSTLGSASATSSSNSH